MGGQSFKCPLCPRWFVPPQNIRQHIKDKHHIHNFKLVGVGPATRIIPDLKQEPQIPATSVPPQPEQ